MMQVIILKTNFFLITIPWGTAKHILTVCSLPFLNFHKVIKRGFISSESREINKLLINTKSYKICLSYFQMISWYEKMQCFDTCCLSICKSKFVLAIDLRNTLAYLCSDNMMVLISLSKDIRICERDLTGNVLQNPVSIGYKEGYYGWRIVFQTQHSTAKGE